jgi:hypothetical protein
MTPIAQRPARPLRGVERLSPLPFPRRSEEAQPNTRSRTLILSACRDGDLDRFQHHRRGWQGNWCLPNRGS